MEFKEKIIKEKIALEHWEEIKKQKNKLVDILTGNRSLDHLDYALFLQCAVIIAEKLEIYDDKTKDFDEFFLGQNLSLNDVLEKINYLLIAVDPKSPINKKIEAIDKVKRIAWKSVQKDQEKIINLITNYQPEEIQKNMSLIFKCISVIILELDMSETEIKMLEDMYS